MKRDTLKENVRYEETEVIDIQKEIGKTSVMYEKGEKGEWIKGR